MDRCPSVRAHLQRHSLDLLECSAPRISQDLGTASLAARRSVHARAASPSHGLCCRVWLPSGPGCGKRWDLGWWRGPGSRSGVVVTFHDSRALSKMDNSGWAAWVSQESPAPAGGARKSGGKSGNPCEQGSAAAFPNTPLNTSRHRARSTSPGNCLHRLHSHHFSSRCASPFLWMLPRLPSLCHPRSC